MGDKSPKDKDKNKKQKDRKITEANPQRSDVKRGNDSKK